MSLFLYLYLKCFSVFYGENKVYSILIFNILLVYLHIQNNKPIKSKEQ